MSGSSSVGDGWTCSQCGSYVPYGCTHSCPPMSVWVNPQVGIPYKPDPLDRIATALERIADSLAAGGDA